MQPLLIEKLKDLQKYVNKNEPVKFYGWLDTKRDHGGLLFWEIRRDDSTIQAVISGHLIEKVVSVTVETVIVVTGLVINRDKENVNSKIENGDLEIKVEDIEILSPSLPLPFQIDEADKVSEHLAQEYRYLSLRKGRTRSLIKKRVEFFTFLRKFMSERDFLEINTPILTASSPEGARDFLVPSRLHPGKFYALPQSPQIFKQLLMLSGFEKYFQLAPCFRDEDARVDRSPLDFYQLDFEIAFTKQQTVLDLLQELIIACYEKFAVTPLGNKIFPVIAYKEALENYGTDKPDLRNKVKIVDVTEFFRDSEFNIFRERIKQGDRVKAFVIPETKNRPFFDKCLEKFLNETKLRIAYTYKQDENWMGPIAQFMDNRMDFGSKGMFFFCQSQENLKKYVVHLHKMIAEEGKFIDHSKDEYCFIVDFPMFEYDEEKRVWDFCHNPFAMPKEYAEDMPMENILAQQYDLVGNGLEVASGAIRNHDLELFKKMCKIVGYTEERLYSSFPAFMKGFKYGAPPHGGAAPGLERLMMILFGCERIRDIIPFYALQNGRDLLMNAPSEVSAKHLKELYIKTIL